jgi:hypothetical protein
VCPLSPLALAGDSTHAAHPRVARLWPVLALLCALLAGPTARFQEDLEWRRMYEQILRNKPLGLGFELEILKLARYEKNLALMMPPPGKGLTGFIPDAIKGNPAELIWGLLYHFVEVKAWKDLSNTGNLRAMIEYVQRYGGHIELWVRSTRHTDGATQLSQPLWRILTELKEAGMATIKAHP